MVALLYFLVAGGDHISLFSLCFAEGKTVPSLSSEVCRVQSDGSKWREIGNQYLDTLFSVQVVLEYERAVIFRLGQLLPGGAKGPGQSLPLQL